MREIRKIIIHNTDSDFGDIETIDSWHKQRGWRGIGYHFVIGNAYPKYSNLKNRIPVLEHDGVVLEGRDIEQIGAHTKGHNYDSIGIALVGTNTFSKAQIYSLIQLIKLLLIQFNLSIKDVYAHYEFNPYKSCPNINMDTFRNKIFYDK